MKGMVRTLFASMLAVLARGIVRKYKPKVVMITGSVGKTSTKDAVAAVLSEAFYVRKSEKSYNSEFGVPLTIVGTKNPWSNPIAWLKVFKEALALRFLPSAYPNLLVLEVGADRPGDLAKILNIVLPDAVVVTKLPEVPVHVEAYATPAAVREEEFYPAYGLDEGMPLIINSEDEYAKQMSTRTAARVITFGATGDIRMTHEQLVGNEMQATLTIEGKEYTLSIPGVVGRPALLAPAAAVATAVALGMKPEEALKGLEAYLPPPGRARLLRGIKGSMLIDDTYNSSPAATVEALASLSLLAKQIQRRRVAVLGDMLELGRYSHEEHARIGEIAAKETDLLCTVGIRARGIAEAAKSTGMPEEFVYSFSNSEEAIRALPSILEGNDAILIKGSQSIRTERITEALLADPDDKQYLVRQDAEWKRR